MALERGRLAVIVLVVEDGAGRDHRGEHPDDQENGGEHTQHAAHDADTTSGRRAMPAAYVADAPTGNGPAAGRPSISTARVYERVRARAAAFSNPSGTRRRRPARPGGTKRHAPA